MRKSVEAVFGRILTSETPSNEYLSTKLEELEQEEPTASRLDEASDSTGRIMTPGIASFSWTRHLTPRVAS